MSNLYTVANAYKYINFAKESLLKLGIEKDSVDDYERHSLNVAKVAKIIGSHYENIDLEKLESLALFHDVGKYKLDRICHRSHCVTGYELLMKNGLNEAAKVCMSHAFPFKRFNKNTEALFFNNKKDIEFTKRFLDETQFNIYDEIIQLSDSMARHNGLCSIEERFDDMSVRYNNPELKNEANVYLKLKDKLEKQLGISIYKELGIENKNNVTSMLNGRLGVER